MLNEIYLTECLRCGKCKEFCQSYKLFLNESYSPRGRLTLINAFEEKKIEETRSFKQRIFSCLLCGTCENICPIDINITNLLYETRSRTKKEKLHYLFKYFSLYPGIFFFILQKLSRYVILRKRFSFLNKISVFEIKPLKKNFLRVYSKLKPVGRVALFNGCSANYLMPSIGESLIYILDRLNFEVIVPEQNCCGAPLFSAGFKLEAIKLAEKNLKIYKTFNIDGVISPCPTCSHFIKDIYKELTGEGINVLNLSDLFDEKTIISGNFSVSESDSPVFFHVSCHSSNYIKDDDRNLHILRKMGIPEVEKVTGCCGFAGLFSFIFEKQSMDILRKKVLEYKKAKMIISSCPNCMIQFKFAMKDKKISHFTEVIHKILQKGEKNG